MAHTNRSVLEFTFALCRVMLGLVTLIVRSTGRRRHSSTVIDDELHVFGLSSIRYYEGFSVVPIRISAMYALQVCSSRCPTIQTPLASSADNALATI